MTDIVQITDTQKLKLELLTLVSNDATAFKKATEFVGNDMLRFELFRTLQSRGVESRMIYFPDENHWILKPNNSIYWYNQVKDWMTRFAEPGAR